MASNTAVRAALAALCAAGIFMHQVVGLCTCYCHGLLKFDSQRYSLTGDVDMSTALRNGIGKAVCQSALPQSA